MTTSATSPYRQKSKTVGYGSPTAHQLELALREEEEQRYMQNLEHAYHRAPSTTSATNRSHSTLRKQYFRHCRTDSENEREDNKRKSKTLQSNNEERNWKKHQSMKLDPLERIGVSASSLDSSTCGSSSSNRNLFSKFISKLSKKKSSNNLF